MHASFFSSPDVAFFELRRLSWRTWGWGSVGDSQRVPSTTGGFPGPIFVVFHKAPLFLEKKRPGKYRVFPTKNSKKGWMNKKRKRELLTLCMDGMLKERNLR